MEMNNRKMSRIVRVLFMILLTVILAVPDAAVADTADVGNDSIIYIDSADDLLELADNCAMDTWSQDKTVFLRADVSLSGIRFETIPIFGGIFDGGGHTISGLELSSGCYPAGLFGIIQEGAVVRNLIVEGTVSPSGDADTVGGIVGLNNGIVVACAFSGSVSGKSSTGGIAGVNGLTGELKDCSVSGGIFGRHATGGIAGQIEPYIDMDLSADLLSELQREIDTLSYLVDNAISDADGSLQTAVDRLNNMADYLDSAAVSVGNLTASAGIESSVDGLGSIGTGLGASTIITINASQHELSAALSGMTGQLKLLNSEMSGASSELSGDVRAINYQANTVADTAMKLLDESELGDGQSIVSDTSEIDVGAISYGKTGSCTNSGQVYGDIDVGGIAGSLAIEYELDPEDDTSSDLSNEAQSRYELKAVIQNCVNSGVITAKKDCVGGICGRMDLGLILGCEGYGAVESESGDYTGGITGLSHATIRSCYSKCELIGRNYIGGAVGAGCAGDDTVSGSVTAECRTLVIITSSGQYVGAISGGGEGEYTDNYYVSDELTGLGQTSYAGRAAPVSYEELMQDARIPDEFRSFSLTFSADGEEIESIEFQYGDSFEDTDFPDIPVKTGCYAQWDTDTLEDLRFDTVVTAVYTPYITALSCEDCRGSGRPIVYVEGDFCDWDSVVLLARAKTPDEFDQLAGDFEEGVEKYFSCFESGEFPQMYICREIVEQWHVTMPDDGQATHTIRYLPPDEDASNLKVFCRQDGQWQKVDSGTIGSYLTFKVPGNDAEFAVLSVFPVWWVWLLAAVLLLLIVLLIARAIKKTRKRKAKKITAAKPAAPAAGEPDEAAIRILAAEEKLRQVEAELRALRGEDTPSSLPAATAVLDKPKPDNSASEETVVGSKKKHKKRALIKGL